MSDGWIGVDLDGTLAEYGEWQGPEHIGNPIPLMLKRVQRWMAEGREVRIVTARVSVPGQRKYVMRWLKKHGLATLAVTHKKDFEMLELWDDRCVRVEKNTGRMLCRSTRGLK